MCSFNNKFGIQDAKVLERKHNIREEKVKDIRPKVVFSFKDFDRTQIPPGQSYEDWQEKKRLVDIFQKMEEISKYDIIEAQQQQMIKIYPEFPPKSGFKYPQTVARHKDIKWAVIMNIGGQKPRVVGHIIGNVFYVVFLDMEHKFYPAPLKHT